jgi:23S rRNA (cytidine1920-2'-O)/16S rRNA (cytidine1409-2'-O)-methyltransferase
VADLSFISLRLVLPALAACTGAGGDLVLMIKPQFEVGRDRVGAGGVVRDAELRAEAVLDVAAAAAGLGLGVAGVTASPLPGPSGNVEFFVWFRHGAPPVDAALVRAVVAAGPAGTIASAGPSASDKAGPPASDKAGPPASDKAGPPASDKEHP